MQCQSGQVLQCPVAAALMVAQLFDVQKCRGKLYFVNGFVLRRCHTVVHQMMLYVQCLTLLQGAAEHLLIRCSFETGLQCIGGWRRQPLMCHGMVCASCHWQHMLGQRHGQYCCKTESCRPRACTMHANAVDGLSQIPAVQKLLASGLMLSAVHLKDKHKCIASHT